MLSESTWPTEIRSILQTLSTAGYEAYLVGGCVRDYLVERPIHDFDIATNALPANVTNLFEDVKPTGVQHGTVTVLVGRVPVEVTTYRIEGDYSDGRHPDEVCFTGSIREDLGRRDFTMNAMALDATGQLLDPFGGRLDIDNRILRTVGSPSKRFGEDGLRMFRGLRFAAELNLTIEANTKSAMFECSSRLQSISAERIGKELMRIAAANWWSIRQLLGDGPWLEDTSPCLQPVRKAMLQLERMQDRAREWYVAADAMAAGKQELRHTAFLATLLTVLPDDREQHHVEILFRKLAWKKTTCSRARKVAQLVMDDPARWHIQDWRQRLFDFGKTTVHMACRLADWLRTSGPCAGSAVTSYYQVVSSQPLYNLRDLRVDGRVLTSLGACGPVVGRLKRQLAYEVLNGKLENDAAKLRNRSKVLLKEFQTDVHDV